MYYIHLIHKGNLYMAYVDDVFTGPLYQSDIKKLNLPEEGVIRQETVNTLQETVYRRAFNKATNLLSGSELCANEIRFKLKMRDYPASVIEDVVRTLYEYRFLDDVRYAENYIRSFASKKSRSFIVKELTRKGIDSSCFENLLDTVYEEEGIDEEQLIQDILDRRFADYDRNDEKVKRKIVSYMARRGFSPNEVNNYLT